MRIRAIDPVAGPIDDLRAVWEIDRACLLELQTGERGQSESEAIAYMRNTQEGEQRPRFVAEEDGRVVGHGALFVHAQTFVYVQIRVLPGERRRRIGAGLLEVLCGTARDHGVTSFFGHHATEAGAAFAAWAGAVDDQRDVRSQLQLATATLPEPVVPGRWALQTWVGPTPDALVASYLEVRNALNDAPTPGGQDFGEMSVDDLRGLEAACERRGAPPRVTVALDESGRVGSFTEVRHTIGSPDAAITDSATRADARGNGLATAVKLESLRRLRADAPQVERVLTLNAEDNAAIRAINTRLGFVPVVTLTTTVLAL